MNLTTDQLKMVFGLILLLCLVFLLAVIGLGHVHEDSSYGMLEVTTILASLGGQFSNWAFGNKPTGLTPEMLRSILIDEFGLQPKPKAEPEA